MRLSDLFAETLNEVTEASSSYAAFEARCLREVTAICAAFARQIGAPAESAKIVPESQKLDEHRCIEAVATLDFGGQRVSVPLSFDFEKDEPRVVIYDGRGGEHSSHAESERPELFAAIVKRAKALVMHRLRVP